MAAPASPLSDAALMSESQRTLAHYCQWWPEGERRTCYAPARLVLVRPSSRTLAFACAAAWRGGGRPRSHGGYLVLERAESEERGAGSVGQGKPTFEGLW